MSLLRYSNEKWKRTNSFNFVINSLILHYYSESKLVKTLTDTSEGDPTKRAAEHAISRHEKTVSGNHGIKRKNLYEMLLPVGFYPTFFDESLLVSLSELGKKRGLIAHKSHAIVARQLMDPFQEAKSIENIIKDIEIIDVFLEP